MDNSRQIASPPFYRREHLFRFFTFTRLFDYNMIIRDLLQPRKDRVRMMEKRDLRKELKRYFEPSARTPEIIEVPEFQYLMVDGHGNPNTSESFKEAVEALYSLSYTLKFEIKKRLEIDYPVLALEGLYTGTPFGQTAFTEAEKELWDWTLMIQQPEWITPELVSEMNAVVAQKKNPPGLSRLRFERMHEGLCVQMLHIGSYASEGPTFEKMMAFAREQGYRMCGKHHEIYLSDPNRAAPEKMRTGLRHPLCMLDGTPLSASSGG